jgi:hypothetical protein
VAAEESVAGPAKLGWGGPKQGGALSGAAWVEQKLA